MRHLRPMIYGGQCWVRDGMCEATGHQQTHVKRHQWSVHGRAHCNTGLSHARNSRPGDLQQLGDNGGAGNFDEHDVVETNAVERVQECKPALDLVCFDHALEHVTNGQRLTLAREMVSDRENGAQIV